MNGFPITQTAPPPGFIDLGMGNPDLSLLPLGLLHKSAEVFFTGNDRRPLQYGAEVGDGYFRHALAAFLEEVYNAAVDPDRLFVTAGASSALDLLCTLYTRPGDTILVEEPTYFLALRIFEDHGLKLIPVPMDEDGLSIEALDEILANCQPKFIYTIPTFQNPSGLTLSQARRSELVQRAQRHDFLILADEVYHCLPYGQKPPAPFAVITEAAEGVISINSFSKILAPGLRLGWIQAHNAVIKRLASCGLLDSGGGMNPFTSALVRNLIESGGLAKHIAYLHQEYAHRLAVMDAALRQVLPQAEYRPPQGGFFFWVRLPGVDTAALRRKAQRFNVDLRQGALFSSQEGQNEYMRLSFAYYGAGQIETGLQRLGACIG